MKKILVLAALVAAMFVTSVASAAPIRVERELGWKNRISLRVPTAATEYSNVARALASFDTAGVGDLGLDTTGVFTMRDIHFPPNFPVLGAVTSTAGFSANDSLLIGYLYVYRDSTAAGSPSLTGYTATFECSSDGLSWKTAQAYGTISVAAGESQAFCPIFFVPSSGSDWKLLSNKLRIIFTTVNGILPAARAKIVYWADDGRR
jgi:hypothetical protein